MKTVFIVKPFVFLLFISALMFSCTRPGRKYYFASMQTGKEDGTMQHPFTSLKSIDGLQLKPGDSIFFRGGDTLAGSFFLKDINGTEEDNIVFSSYGSSKCVINGGNGAAWIIDSVSYFQIVDLVMRGNGRKKGNSTNGLKLDNCKEVGVRNVDISGFQKSGLLLYDCEGVEADGVVAHENGATGILVEGDYQKRISNHIHIINCRAEDNPGDPTNLDNHSGNGILVGNCKNVLIEYCTATNNGWDMPRIGNGPVGIWAYEADSVIIQHCISYRNKTKKGAADGGGFDLDGGVTNSVIQYCLSYDNWGSGYGIYQYWSASKWSHNTVRYCISINDGYETDGAAGMIIWNGWNGDSTFDNFAAYNNIFYNERKYAFSFSPLSAHKKFSFFNNIFIASDTSDIYNGTDSSANDTFLGNVWMRVGGGFAQNGFVDFKKWAESTGYEQLNGNLAGCTLPRTLFYLPDSIDVTDPYFLNKNPLMISLCNDVLNNKGIDIARLFSIDKGKTDFFGNEIPSKNDNDVGICVE